MKISELRFLWFFRKNGFSTLCPEITDADKLAADADAVLLDINLDRTDGFQICKSIRKWSNIPILFVTGRNSKADELKAMAFKSYCPSLCNHLQKKLQQLLTFNLS